MGYLHSSCPHTPTYVKGRTSTKFIHYHAAYDYTFDQ